MSYKEQCIILYQNAFGPDPVFDRELFDGFFDYCSFLTEADKVVSMLFALPCLLHDGARQYPARYIFAAATAPELRGQGHMTRLLNIVCTAADTVYLLKPATDALIEYYRDRGFLPFRAVRSLRGARRVEVDGAFRRLARDDRADESVYTAMYRYPSSLVLDGLAFSYLME